MDYKRILDGLFNAFVSERTRLGPVYLIMINWALVVVPTFMAYKAWGTDQFNITLAAAAVALFVVLALSLILGELRYRKRKTFYGTIRHPFGAPAYNDYSKDSSRFVKVRWNWLRATRLSFKITVSNLTLRTTKNALNDLESMFPPGHGKRWIIALDLLRQGTFNAEVVPSDSYQSARFDAVLTLTDLARDQLSYNGFPVQLSFVADRNEGRRFAFDEVTIDKTGSKTIGPIQEEKILTLMERTYSPAEGRSWMLDQTDSSSYRFYQEDKLYTKALRQVRAILNGQMSTLGGAEHPDIRFENAREESGRYAFDAVIIDGLAAQTFGDFKSSRLASTFESTFPLPRGMTWAPSMQEGVLTITRQRNQEASADYASSTATVASRQASAKSQQTTTHRQSFFEEDDSSFFDEPGFQDDITGSQSSPKPVLTRLPPRPSGLPTKPRRPERPYIPNSD